MLARETQGKDVLAISHVQPTNHTHTQPLGEWHQTMTWIYMKNTFLAPFSRQKMTASLAVCLKVWFNRNKKYNLFRKENVNKKNIYNKMQMDIVCVGHCQTSVNISIYWLLLDLRLVPRWKRKMDSFGCYHTCMNGAMNFSTRCRESLPHYPTIN